jgi:hypothetical protein
MTTVHPRRLVMIQIENDCMFCENPLGKSYCYYVSLYDKLGYISCANCKEKAQHAVAYWHNTIAFGKVRYLKDKQIKIKRSLKNGIREIEDGWKISHPITRNEEGNEMVYCHHEEKRIGRWCYIDEVMELNPI